MYVQYIRSYGICMYIVTVMHIVTGIVTYNHMDDCIMYPLNYNVAAGSLNELLQLFTNCAGTEMCNVYCHKIMFIHNFNVY